jgi:hypothetical protein
MQTDQSPNGAGKIIAGQQQVLASLLRAMSASEAPKAASQGATRP